MLTRDLFDVNPADHAAASLYPLQILMPSPILLALPVTFCYRDKLRIGEAVALCRRILHAGSRLTGVFHKVIAEGSMP